MQRHKANDGYRPDPRNYDDLPGPPALLVVQPTQGPPGVPLVPLPRRTPAAAAGVVATPIGVITETSHITHPQRPGVGAAARAVELTSHNEPAAAEVQVDEEEHKAEDSHGGLIHEAGTLAAGAGGSMYESMHSLYNMLWWISITLPYEAASWMAQTSWQAASRIGQATMDGLGYVVTVVYPWVTSAIQNTSNVINRSTEFLFKLILVCLHVVNQRMDDLVSNTPPLVRDTLTHTAAKGVDEGAPALAGSELSEEEEEFQLSRIQETDIAVAANQALHRVFDKAQSDRSSTVLAEARKLVWHCWMLIALQVTALKTIAKVTQGLFMWVCIAWLGLMGAGLIFGLMSAITPLAATAAAFAWCSHFLLKQVLSLRDCGTALQGFAVPPIHAAVKFVKATADPYLATESHEEGGGTPGLMSSMQQRVSTWMDASERHVSTYLPEAAPVHPKTLEGEEGGRVAEEAKLLAGAEEAWQKSSALSVATLLTVGEACRVVLIGLSTRFHLSLPTWVPGLAEGSPTETIATSPEVTTFMTAAGQGTLSNQQAVATRGEVHLTEREAVYAS